MIDVNDFAGRSDSEVIENALSHRDGDGVVVIPPRQSERDKDRREWVLDRAILLPGDTTLVLRGCVLKLSDQCRDNFIRSANCGLGIEDPRPLQNIHIRGEGGARLVGADHPRATGDGSKILACPCPYRPEDIVAMAPWVPEERRSVEKLDFWDAHDHSYGTDAGKEDQSQYGDWRGIGILLANVEGFSIEGVTVAASHGWGISLEACGMGTIRDVAFDARMYRWIDGMKQNIENQDGIDLRNGCHHILIDGVTGHTGDDVIALTAIASKGAAPGGQTRTTHVMPGDWTRRESGIHDVIIRNVNAWSQLCYTIRLLSCDTHIWNVIVDGVIDCPPEDVQHGGVLLVGEGDSDYGKNLPDGVRAVTVSNMICHTTPVTVKGYLRDAVIRGVVNLSGKPTVDARRPDSLMNVRVE